MGIVKKIVLKPSANWVRKMSNGYIFEKLPEHPLAQGKGLILQHRRVWFDKHGKIPKGCVIHHKNGKRGDNRLSNLECLTRSEHSRHHFPHGFDENQGHPPIILEFVCGICWKRFKKLKAQYDWNKCHSKRKKYEPLCSEKCVLVLMVRIKARRRNLGRPEEK